MYTLVLIPSRTTTFCVDVNALHSQMIGSEQHFRFQVPLSRRSLWMGLLLSLLCGDDLERQAQVLFVAFGPTRMFHFRPGPRGTMVWLMWNELSDPLEEEEDAAGVRTAFQTLAEAIDTCRAKWSLDDLYRIVSQVTKCGDSVGDGWDPQNVASLLLLCCPHVRRAFLTRKVLWDPCDVADVLVYMLLQADALGVPLQALTALARETLRQSGLTCCAVSSIVDAFWTAAVDLIRGSESKTRRKQVEHAQCTPYCMFMGLLVELKKMDGLCCRSWVP